MSGARTVTSGDRRLLARLDRDGEHVAGLVRPAAAGTLVPEERLGANVCGGDPQGVEPLLRRPDERGRTDDEVHGRGQPLARVCDHVGAQQSHAENIERLSAQIFGAHVDHTT